MQDNVVFWTLMRHPSDRDPRFTSRFWESLNKALGTKPRLSSAYQPTPLCWLEPRENLTLGPEVVQQNTKKVKLIQERMRTTQSR